MGGESKLDDLSKKSLKTLSSNLSKAFINFLTKALGDIKDFSISIDGGKRIPVKDLKKKIN